MPKGLPDALAILFHPRNNQETTGEVGLHRSTVLRLAGQSPPLTDGKYSSATGTLPPLPKQSAYRLAGAQAILEDSRDPSSRQISGTRSDGLFVATSAALITVAVFAGLQLFKIDWSALGSGVVRLASAIPCTREASDASALKAGAEQQIDQASREALDAAMLRVDQELDEAFSAAEQGVDRYLDWYFSFIGNYTRLGAIVIPKLDEQMREQFVRRIFVETKFDEQISRIAGEADSLIIGQLATTTAAIGHELSKEVGAQRCLRDAVRPIPLVDLTRDKVRATLSTAVALPMSGIAIKLAGQASEGALAKAAARQTMKAAATAVGKTATKRGVSVVVTATTAVAMCSPGGPLVLACGIVAGIVTWFGVDIAMMAIDEAVFREKMKADLLEELRGQRTALREALRQQLEQVTNLYGLQAKGAVEKVFVPARTNF